MVIRLGCAFLLVAVGAVADWRADSAAADKAYRAKDWAQSKEWLLKLYAPMGGHPNVVYGLARAEAQLGNTDAAMKWLRHFVAMGVVRNMEKDPDLEPLRKHADFAAVAAAMREKQKPFGGSVPVLRFADPDLLTEDITWDSKRAKFLVTSIHRAKVLVVAKDGSTETLVSGVLPAGWGFLGLAADPKRSTLWVTAAAMEGASGFVKSLEGKTSLYAFDLATGKLQRKYDAAEPGVWGEALILDDGSVLLSNALGGLDILKPGAAAVESFVAKGELGSPQSTAARGDVVYVADYIRGVTMVDRKSRKVSLLPQPDDVCVQGIDGLYLDGRSLVAIQNGASLTRIVRLHLDATGSRITRGEVLESKTTAMGEPTHGVFVDGRFHYLANTGWDRVEGAQMKPGEPAEIRRCEGCESIRHD